MSESLINKASVLRALGRGRKEGKTAARLVLGICGTYMQKSNERELRAVVSELRKEGHRICATPQDGYFIVETEQELLETCDFLYGRAMNSLVQIAAMRRVSLPDLRKQLKLNFQES